MTEGIVNILKPPGMTSSDAVADVRHIFKIKRVGHTGTLDPGAAGVLPICIGRATRLFDILVDKQKEYIAEVTFGAATDTQDAYGRIAETDARIISKDELAAVLPCFIGQIEQTAPMYSAVSIDGKRLYQLAREGADAVEIKRSATIDNIELMAQSGENRYLLRIVCSRGTYVRTLCADIGKRLGTCAYMSFLLRTRSGEFTIGSTYSIAELRQMKEKGRLGDAVISIEDSLNGLIDKLSLTGLDEKQARLIRNGAEIFPGELKDRDDSRIVMLYADGEFLGIGQTGEGGSVQMIYTFTAHPMVLFGKQPPLLMTQSERMAALGGMGCMLSADEFSAEYAATEPEQFIKMLIERFNMGCAVAGFNYTFGKRGEGSVELIKKLGEKYGFAVEIVPPVMYKGEAVSSTRIRACLEAGRVKDAGEMLGAPYSMTGPVIRNRGIGRTLDYPTANIAGWEDRAVPMAGVYATRAVLDGEKYPAVTNIGRNPTVNGEHTTIETHMLGFDADIYGQTLKVEFVERIRGEIRFPDVHTLATQMKADGEKARDILKNS